MTSEGVNMKKNVKKASTNEDKENVFQGKLLIQDSRYFSFNLYLFLSVEPFFQIVCRHFLYKWTCCCCCFLYFVFANNFSPLKVANRNIVRATVEKLLIKL